MVVRIPPADEWITVDDSTVVHQMAFDETAQRIFVRLKLGGMLVFEDCQTRTWALFRVPGISKGAYVSQVLSLHPHVKY